MKTIKSFHRLFFGFMAVCLASSLAITLSSCEKDDDEAETSEIETIFVVEDATLHTGSFPSGSDSGPSIVTFSGNSYILPGGSNAITVETNEEANSIFIGVEGLSGYYELPFSVSAGTQSSITIYVFIDSEIDMEDFAILLALNLNGNVGIHEHMDVELVEAGTGKLQVSLSWDKEVDLDLYLVEPGGATICYIDESSANGGELDIDSNAGCGIDGINNENITYEEEAILEAGEYIVRVNLWSNCDISDQINYIATARLNGNILTPSWGNNPYYGNYPENSESQHGGVDAGEEVIKFEISSSKLENLQSFAKFTFPVDEEKEYPTTK
ncbi:MAG: hypothetical protein R6U62_01630 [Bacteroidales bacterium]